MLKIRQIKININHINILVLAIAIALATIATFSYDSAKKSDSQNQTVSYAINLFESGKQDEAIKIVETILKNDPKNEEAKMRLALFYYQAKNYPKFLDFAEANDIKSATIESMMASVYQNNGDYTKAEEYYNLAINQDSNSAQVYILFAAYYQSQGKYDLALSVLEKGLEKKPKSTALLISAASISLKMSVRNKAAEYAGKALAIVPGNLQAKSILDQAE